MKVAFVGLWKKHTRFSFLEKQIFFLNLKIWKMLKSESLIFFLICLFNNSNGEFKTEIQLKQHFLNSPLEFLTLDFLRTVGTRNKAQLGLYRIVPYCGSFPYCEFWVFVCGKLVRTEKCPIENFYTIVKSLIESSNCTVRTFNKALVVKNKIIPFCRSFLYCESWLFCTGKLVSTEKYVIVSFYTSLKSLFASSDWLFSMYYSWNSQ